MKNALQEKTYYLLVLSLSVFLAFLAYFLTPLFFIGGYIGFFVTIFIGLSMGWFIAIFMKEIDFLTKHHHFSLIIVVFVSSVVFFSTMYTSYLYSTNPLLIGLTFFISFLMPYIYIHR
ncbi:MAG: hypothetical protein ACMXX9_04610 [Candidatus Woesearchaeota archaeon]